MPVDMRSKDRGSNGPISNGTHQVRWQLGRPRTKTADVSLVAFLLAAVFLVLASPLWTVASLVPTGWRVSSVAEERARQMANQGEQGRI